MSSKHKFKRNFGPQGGPFKPGAGNVSDKESKKPNYTKATSIDESEAIQLKMALFEKENVELKLQNIQHQIDKAQMQAQMQGEQLKTQQEKSKKSFEALIAAVNKKYGLDLTKDKIDLQTGAITRVVAEDPKEAASADEEEEEEDGDNN